MKSRFFKLYFLITYKKNLNFNISNRIFQDLDALSLLLTQIHINHWFLQSWIFWNGLNLYQILYQSSCLFMCFYLKCSFSISSLKAYLRYHFLWQIFPNSPSFCLSSTVEWHLFIFLWVPWWPVSRVFRETMSILVAGAMTYSLCLRQPAQELTYTGSWYIFILQMNE